jgi:cleavage stimulation factor subunit 3
LYETLLNNLNSDIDKLKLTVAAEIETARGPEISAPSAGDIEMDAEVGRLIEERDERGKLVAERRGREVDELCTAASIVWVMYMRFARRAEVGQSASGIRSAANIGHRASKLPEGYLEKRGNPVT